MPSTAVLEAIAGGRIIAILRGDYRGHEEEIVESLAAGGVTAVEVTMNSPDALASIRRIAAHFGDRVAVGAGTVLQPGEVERAGDAGARFMVSPNRDVRVIERTRALGLASFPGCFTPSEIVEALAAGADAAKLFPARSIAPEFLRDVRAPLGDIRLIPTGGVTPERARHFVAAGAWALGVGSELVGRDVLEPGGLDRLTARAAEFVAACRSQGSPRG